jgi:hypothetical protein
VDPDHPSASKPRSGSLWERSNRCRVAADRAVVIWSDGWSRFWQGCRIRHGAGVSAIHCQLDPPGRRNSVQPMSARAVTPATTSCIISSPAAGLGEIMGDLTRGSHHVRDQLSRIDDRDVFTTTTFAGCSPE